MSQYIIEFLAALALLIVVHELGHFLACRLFKIPVEEFGIGLPPRALQLFRSGGTDFTLNWIPLGGFVRPRGENDPQIADGLAAAKPMVRIGVALAGPLANLFLVIVLYTATYALLGEPDPARLDQVEVQMILPGSPAEVGGLQIGDIILALNGQEVHSPDEARMIIYENLDQPVVFRYRRGDVVTEASITPLSDRSPEQGATGVQLGVPLRSINLLKAIGYGFQATYQHATLLFQTLGKLITGQMPGGVNLVGPIGMGRMYVDMREAAPNGGLFPLLEVFGFLISVSISLAFFNLLPIPALDGGRIVLALPQLIFGQRVEARIENWLITLTFLILLGLLIFISLRDVFAPMQVMP